METNVRSIFLRRIFNNSIIPNPQLAYNNAPTSQNGLVQGEAGDSEAQAILEELRAATERLERISPSGFNLGELLFLETNESSTTLPHLEDQGPPEVEGFLDCLRPTDPSTQRFKFVIRSLQSLIGDLELLHADIRPQDSALVSQCLDLLGSTKLELDRLLIAARETRKLQASRQRAHIGVGARRIDFPITPTITTRLPSVTSAAIILTATIHCFMNVSRENCNFILKALRALLQLVIRAQDFPQRDYLLDCINRIPVTLDTSLHYLGIHPNVVYYVVCPRCACLYPETNEVPEYCTAKNIDHQLCGAALMKRHRRGRSSWLKPRKRYSHQTLEDWLAFFLNRPGIEDLIEKARPKPQLECTDFWGASHLTQFPGPGQRSFFETERENLRLVFMVYHDFFNPFTNKTSAKVRSIGSVSMVCLNLPHQIRYNRENVYTTAIIPGPSEPSREKINNYIRPIAQNMKEHYYPGVWMTRTHKYPNGRHIRSAVIVESMDLIASRSWCGLGPPTHTILCSFCSITKDDIDRFDQTYPARNMLDHAHHVQLWSNAPNSTTRDAIWKVHAARYSEWLCFPWWNPFHTPIAPMHWMKNILEKQLRENMDWSWSLPAGIPAAPKTSKLITSLELEWGDAALKYCTASQLKQIKLPEPLLRHLCVRQRVFNAGRNSKYMVRALNDWRLSNGKITGDGQLVCLADQDRFHLVSIAKARYYLSRAKEPQYLVRKTLRDDLEHLCREFVLDTEGTQPVLAKRLVEYAASSIYLNHRNHPLPTTAAEGLQLTSAVAILGCEIMSEIQEDMRNTIIPGWIKTPPVNFGMISHGKIGAEEYKSLSIISLTITLVRLWRNSEPDFSRRLDHLLHLVQAVRILSYQSINQRDIDLFSHHYNQYLADLKELYPHCAITPTQHLGLHVPHFLKTLGPATRFNENPSEMFIGMFQDIPTNWRFGELEHTIHREFITASNLQALLTQLAVTDAIADVGETLQDYLDYRYPSHTGTYYHGWVVTHPKTATLLSEEIYTLLNQFCSTNGMQRPTRHQILGTKMQHGHLVYQPSSASIGNSQILFEAPGTGIWTPGQIEMIAMQNQVTGSADPPQLSIFVRPFVPLSGTDCLHDPYISDPIIGASGAKLAMMLYDQLESGPPTLIRPRDILCHIATCRYRDTEGVFTKPCLVALSLDFKHIRPE